MTITGSCHCGAIAYTLDEDIPATVVACNCSICRRKGSLLHFAAADRFELLTSRDAITSYTFHTHNIRHHFCKICGCAPFSEGTGPDGKPGMAVNLRCAEGVDIEALNVHHYDGASR